MRNQPYKISPKQLQKGSIFSPTFSDQEITCLEDYDQEREGCLVLLDDFATWLTFNGCEDVWMLDSGRPRLPMREHNIFDLQGGQAEVEDELYDAIQDIDEGDLETCYFGRNSDQAYRELLEKELGYEMMAKAHRVQLSPVAFALYITRENLKRAGVSV